VAVLNSVEELQEDTLGQDVVAYKVAMLGNVGEEVTLRAILDNDISAVDGMQDLDEVDHVWVCAGTVVQGDFPFLEPALSGIESDFGKSLDGVWNVGVDIDSSVDDTVCTNAQDTGEFYPASEQVSYSVFRSGGEGSLGV